MTYPRPPAWAGRIPAVGVTGTNGKTSTTLLLAAALCEGGVSAPALTTIGLHARGKTHAPPSYSAYVEALKRELGAGARRCVVEMTSLALAKGVGRSWPLLGGVFTNISHDHLDLHGSFEHYLASKAQLFVGLARETFAVLNADDPASDLIVEVIPEGVKVRRYGTKASATDRIVSMDVSWSGTRVTMADGALVATTLVGSHFGENAVAAWVAAQMCGTSREDAAQGIGELAEISGRFERVCESPHVVVDFAHSPDALTKTLATARSLAGGARVLVVFGAAGGTDPSHRPALGRAAMAADVIVITNDNPRDEDPLEIAKHVRAGIAGREVVVELDRGKAIEHALSIAGSGDVVVIAGKGHERSQRTGSDVRPWSDQDFVRERMGG